ncbi:unnamed protein product [Calypogeia fissa]
MDPTKSLKREPPKSTSFPEKLPTALEIINKGRAAEGAAVLEAVVVRKEAEIAAQGLKTPFENPYRTTCRMARAHGCLQG